MPGTFTERWLLGLIAFLLVIICLPEQSLDQDREQPLSFADIDVILATAQVQDGRLVFPPGYDAILQRAVNCDLIAPSGTSSAAIVLTRQINGEWIDEVPKNLAIEGAYLRFRLILHDETQNRLIERDYVLAAPAPTVNPPIDMLRFIPSPTRNTPERLSNQEG